MTSTLEHELAAVIDRHTERCPHCGTDMQGRWTTDEILEAGRRWIEETGKPPRAHEWKTATRPSWVPATSTVYKRFGTWSAFVLRLGDGYSARVFWTREAILEAMLSWHEAHGEWPSNKGWTRTGRNHPTASTVRYHFGTIRDAIRVASKLAHDRGDGRAVVPTAPLERAVDAWISEDPFELAADGGAGTGRSRAMFAELAGFDATRLTRILAQAHTTRRVADRILDTADAFHLWHIDPDLRAVLEGEAA